MPMLTSVSNSTGYKRAAHCNLKRSKCRIMLHLSTASQKCSLRSRIGGVINTEVVTADSWALTNRAALLSLKVEELNRYIQEDPENCWLAVCEPERLFALRELCKLLQADVGLALQLVQQEPALLDAPARLLEANAAGLQSLLQLPSASLTQLLQREPRLLLAGPPALEARLQRLAGALGLPAAGPEAKQLLVLLPRLGLQALADCRGVEQQVQSIMAGLSLSAGDALALLQAEADQGQDLAALLSPEGVQALVREWRLCSEQVQLPLNKVMAALTRQLSLPDARYGLTSAQLLCADVTNLQAVCQAGPASICSMLLAAPRLALVPASFWQLLLQYVLFLMPHWRQQLESMSPAEAGATLAQLFDEMGCDLADTVSVSRDDVTFATADVDYNQELSVLEALLDQGMTAPGLTGPGTLTAGRVWRLLYLCNPRLAVQSRQHAHTASGSAGSSSPWSWVMGLQLPLPLVKQLQQQGVLSCELPGPGPKGIKLDATTQQSRSDGTAAAVRGKGGAEPLDSLSQVVTADVQHFCDTHPGYAHWLHNAAFELEWAGSKAAVPIITWDV